MATSESAPAPEVDTVGTQRELELLIHAVRESLTDNIVERLAGSATNVMSLVDRLDDEDTADAIHTIIDRVTEFHRLGALGTLFESVLLLHAVRESLTDSIVDRGMSYIERLVNTVGSEATLDCLEDVLSAFERAQDSTDSESSGNVFSTLWLLMKPESQRTIRYMLKLGGEFAKIRR